MFSDKEKLLKEMVYVEDELGVIIYNLNKSELNILAKLCTALAALPEDERDELYDQLNPDRIDDDEDDIPYSVDEDGELN